MIVIQRTPLKHLITTVNILQFNNEAFSGNSLVCENFMFLSNYDNLNASIICYCLFFEYLIGFKLVIVFEDPGFF